MSSAFDTEKSILCAFNISNDCPGFCTREQLFVDELGDIWDYCWACAKHEQDAIYRQWIASSEDEFNAKTL